jgi:alanine dehydrogenase
MPGAVPRTSTFALTNATISYVTRLADKGLEKAIADEPFMVTGLNTYKGTVPHKAVAEALNVPFSAYRSAH